MADELNIPLTVTDNTAGAFKSAATNLRNITDVARRNNMSVEEWQKKGSQQQLALSEREVKELKRNVQEHEKAQEKKTHASKRHADAHVHHASVSRAASEQVVEILAETAAKYLSVAAAIEGTREAFMGFAREDATLRRMSVTFNKSLHDVEHLTPAWRATGQAVGASLNEMIDGIDALGKASNKGLDVGSKAIEAMAKGGKALGLTTREAGEIQGAFMRNMGVSGEEAIEVWRQLSAASDAYKLDIKALAPMLPALTVDAERLGYKGTGGVAQVVAMLGKLQATGDAGGGLSRVYRELTSPRIGQMLGREEKRWALELDDVKARGGDVFSYVMGLWQKEKEQNKALTVERMFGERNAKFINALMKDSTKGADDLLRSMKEIYAAGKSGVILDAKLTTVTTGAQASVKRMSDEFEHMSTSFGQMIAVMGAPEFLKGAAEKFDYIARKIEGISKKIEEGSHKVEISPRNIFGFRTMKRVYPEGEDHTKKSDTPGPRSSIGTDLFNAVTATAKIPGDAYGGKYKSEPATPGILTEEDAFRENQARDQEGRDALGLAAYGLGATGAVKAGRFKRTREAAKLSVPDFIPGGLRKKIGGEGEVPLAVPVEKIILPIASLDNNIERLTKEVAALKSVLETPRETKFRSRVGGTAPWEERAYQRRIDSHVPGDAGPTSGTATGELLGAFPGMGGRGGSGGGGRSATGALMRSLGGSSRQGRSSSRRGGGGGGGGGIEDASDIGVSGDSGAGLKGSAYLQAKRAGFAKELENPETRKLAGAITSAENPGAGPAVLESLMNRTEMVNEQRARKGLPPKTLRQMIIGERGKSFYGPVRSGAINSHLAKMNNPAYAAKMNAITDRALGGSNTIQSYTDQGSAGDPNYIAGGVGININRERFNDWGVAGSKAWRLRRQQAISAGGPAATTATGEEYGPQQPEAMRGAVPGLDQYKKMREELEKPIPISFKHDRSVQFARASAAREHDREMRETRHNVNADIGAA